MIIILKYPCNFTKTLLYLLTHAFDLFDTIKQMRFLIETRTVFNKDHWPWLMEANSNRKYQLKWFSLQNSNYGSSRLVCVCMFLCYFLFVYDFRFNHELSTRYDFKIVILWHKTWKIEFVRFNISFFFAFVFFIISVTTFAINRFRFVCAGVNKVAFTDWSKKKSSPAYQLHFLRATMTN